MKNLWSFLGAATNDKAFEVGRSIGTIVGFAVVALMCVGVPALLVVSIVQYTRTKTRGWLISLVVSGILSLIPVGLFVSGVAMGLFRAMKERAQNAENTITLPTDRIVQTPDGGLSLQMAENWRTLTGLNEQAIIQVGNPVREEYLIVLSAAKSDFTGSLEDFATTTSDAIVNNLVDGSATELQEITLKGREAYQRELTGTVATFKVEYQFTAVEGTNDYYQILMWTLRSKKSTAFPVFREVLETCELH